MQVVTCMESKQVLAPDAMGGPEGVTLVHSDVRCRGANVIPF
jgi:hypothetical protein